VVVLVIVALYLAIMGRRVARMEQELSQLDRR
jgi:CcmD family protein